MYTKPVVISLILLFLVGVIYWGKNDGGQSMGVCISFLYEEDRSLYEFWKSKYTDLHPEYTVYDAGSYCRLSGGNQIVSFSFFKKNSDEWNGVSENSAGQSVALFDKEGTYIKETKGLYQSTLGDLTAPIVAVKENGEVRFRFSSFDGKLRAIQTYSLNTEDFSFLKIEETLEE